MIQTFPRDFSTHTYDLKTDDGLLWEFQKQDEDWMLVSGDLELPLISYNDLPTLFTTNYVNINIHGFTIDGVYRVIEEAVPNENWVEPPVIESIDGNDPLSEKEIKFATKLKELADKFSIDLTTLGDINIGSLLEAAVQAEIPENDIANASAILLALAKDVEAESNLNWAETWQGLKSRLPTYLIS